MLYITDFCSYTAGGTINKSSSLSDLKEVAQGIVYAQEPDYKDLIPPMQLRRMSKPIRISIAAIKSMLNLNNDVQQFGAINVGTALGLLSDSESFLSQMVKQDEQMLTPTFFIQSTQNTIGGQIALLLKCAAHNMTFTQRGHSFEHALLDIDLLDDEDMPLLVGGVDEMTPHYYTILNQLMWQYNRTDKNIDLGEGAAFFLMTKTKQANTIATIKDFTSFTSKDTGKIVASIKAYLAEQGIANVNDYHWVFGDHQVNEWDDAYSILQRDLALENVQLFKPYTSNYATVGSAGLAYSIKYMLENQVNKTIFINNYLKYWSVFILER